MSKITKLIIVITVIEIRQLDLTKEIKKVNEIYENLFPNFIRRQNIMK